MTEAPMFETGVGDGARGPAHRPAGNPVSCQQ